MKNYIVSHRVGGEEYFNDSLTQTNINLRSFEPNEMGIEVSSTPRKCQSMSFPCWLRVEEARNAQSDTRFQEREFRTPASKLCWKVEKSSPGR